MRVIQGQDTVNTAGGTQKTPLLAVFAGVLAVITVCHSCSDKTDHYSHLRERVNLVRAHTIPTGAIVANKSGPTLSTYSATAHWEFRTSEERRDYLSWVRQQLGHDGFKSNLSDEGSLVLIKISQAETESLRVQAMPADGMLHVQITYSIDSD